MSENTEDDTFAALRAMSFDEALQFAIDFADKFPLGSTKEKILVETDYELRRFGWSYQKLNEVYHQKHSISKKR